MKCISEKPVPFKKGKSLQASSFSFGLNTSYGSKYEISKEILGHVSFANSKGSSSVVKKATIKATGEKIAMKIIRSDDEALMEEVSKEYKILVQLDHPNIPKAYEPIKDKKFSTLYIPIQLFEGFDLEYHVNQRGALKVGSGLQILKSILDTITYLRGK